MIYGGVYDIIRYFLPKMGRRSVGNVASHGFFMDFNLRNRDGLEQIRT